MIDLLVLIEPLIQVALARARGPEDVPLVRVGIRKAILLEDRPHHFVVEPYHLK